MTEPAHSPDVTPQVQAAPTHSAPAAGPGYYVTHAQRPPAPAKNPLLAGFLSMLLCGMGNIYNGLYGRAVVFFALFVSVFFTAIKSGDGPHLALLIPCLAFIWLFNAFDAYRQATLINFGWEEEQSVDLRRQQTSGGVTAGVALLVIGLYGLLEQFFDIDLTVLLDHWYVVTLGLGGWLVYQGLKNRTDDGPGIDRGGEESDVA